MSGVPVQPDATTSRFDPAAAAGPTPDPARTKTMIAGLRSAFPALAETVNGYPLVYLDSAASAHKPLAVIEAMQRCITSSYSNVHRGAHTLAERATELFEQTRQQVNDLLSVPDSMVSIFTANATTAVNLVATSYGLTRLKSGDVILLTVMEHHSNYVPWLMVAERTGARIRTVGILADGRLDMDDFRNKLDEQVRMVAITHVSNVLGVRNDVRTVVRLAHAAGAVVMVDGAQAVPDMPVSLAELDADFYCWSGHKLYGPTGIGILTGRRSLLEQMPPFLYGGAMIETVGPDYFTPAPLPHKFEAGTPPLIEVAGLSAAVDFVRRISLSEIAVHKAALLALIRKHCAEIDGVAEIGNYADKSGIFSFVVTGAHPHDLATLLDQQGIAVRAGHHCAEPLMRYLRLTGTTRVSFGIYNNTADVDRFATGLKKVLRLLRD